MGPVQGRRSTWRLKRCAAEAGRGARLLACLPSGACWHSSHALLTACPPKPVPPVLPRTLFLPALSQSNQPSVCFIQFLSSRSVKSSRACAPRDSLQGEVGLVGGSGGWEQVGGSGGWEQVAVAECTHLRPSTRHGRAQPFQPLESNPPALPHHHHTCIKLPSATPRPLVPAPTTPPTLTCASPQSAW